MDAAGDLGAMVRQLGDVAEHVDRCAADRRQKHLHVRPRHQFGEHAGSLLEQRAPQLGLVGRKAFRKAGQIPDRIDRDLHHRHAAIGVDDIAVGAQAFCGERLADLRQVQPRARYRDARSNVDALGDVLAEILGDEMPPGIERDDFCGIAPLRKRPDGRRGKGVGEIGTPDRIERAGGHCERPVHRIGAAMAADHVAIPCARHRADDRPAGACVGGAPVDREGGLPARLRMGGQADVVGTVRAAHDQTPKKPTARRSDGPGSVALPVRSPAAQDQSNIL
ncbi:hypothetical protein ACVWW7_002243 [Bradyrhizobium sp. LM6.9]